MRSLCVFSLFVRFLCAVHPSLAGARAINNDDDDFNWRRNGTVQSRRDDLEALAYTLVQLAKGSLPWDSVPGHNKAKRCARIRDCKAKTGVDVICAGLPPCFARFLAYARALSFPETPDYEYCRGLFGSSGSVPSTNRRRHNNNAS